MVTSSAGPSLPRATPFDRPAYSVVAPSKCSVDASASSGRASAATHRIPAVKDAIDQRGDSGRVQFGVSFDPLRAPWCAAAASLRIPHISRSGIILSSFSASSSDSQIASAAVPDTSEWAFQGPFRKHLPVTGERRFGANRSVMIAGNAQHALIQVSSDRFLFGLISHLKRTGADISMPEEGFADVDHDSPLARKLGAYVALSEKELAVLANLHHRRRTFTAGGPGTPGAGPPVRLHPGGRLGLLLQVAARRHAPDR